MTVKDPLNAALEAFELWGKEIELKDRILHLKDDVLYTGSLGNDEEYNQAKTKLAEAEAELVEVQKVLYSS